MYTDPVTLRDWQQIRILPTAPTAGSSSWIIDENDPRVDTRIVAGNLEAKLLNALPTVDFGGPYTGNEGSEITFSITPSDIDGDPLSFYWDFYNDGSWDISASTSTTESFNWNDDFAGPVILGISDGYSLETFPDTGHNFKRCTC